MELQPQRPSLDGISALRSIGDWLALQERWQESAQRYTALVEIDKIDPLGPVTLDFQACGVVLVESGDLAGYERFRNEGAIRFAHETNGDQAGRILRTCVLTPASEEMLAKLQPLGRLVEAWTPAQSATLRRSWPVIPLALWRYRTGELDRAERVCRDALEDDDKSARIAIVRSILALVSQRRGKTTEAIEHVALARSLIVAATSRGLTPGGGRAGRWYDWVFAEVLLREAEAGVP
jgi:hypothetical protein